MTKSIRINGWPLAAAIALLASGCGPFADAEQRATRGKAERSTIDPLSCYSTHQGALSRHDETYLPLYFSQAEVETFPGIVVQGASFARVYRVTEEGRQLVVSERLAADAGTWLSWYPEEAGDYLLVLPRNFYNAAFRVDIQCDPGAGDDPVAGLCDDSGEVGEAVRPSLDGLSRVLDDLSEAQFEGELTPAQLRQFGVQLQAHVSENGLQIAYNPGSYVVAVQSYSRDEVADIFADQQQRDWGQSAGAPDVTVSGTFYELLFPALRDAMADPWMTCDLEEATGWLATWPFSGVPYVAVAGVDLFGTWGIGFVDDGDGVLRISRLVYYPWSP